MNNKFFKKLSMLVLTLLCLNYASNAQTPVKQVHIPLVEKMPDMPTPYKMKDWKEIAQKQDVLLFDHNAKGTLLPLIWWDDTKVNFPMRSFGLPAYVGSIRNMSKGNHYESLPTIGAVLGASLVGINKSNYDGHDYVTMLRQLYNKPHKLVLNSVKRVPGKTFWYELFPTMAFAMVVDQYPDKPEMAEIMQQTVETWNNAVKDMKTSAGYPDFNFTAFDFKTRKGFYNGRWREPDAAAGVAWLQYMGWLKWKKPEYLEAAKASMEFLQQRDAKEGVFYEIIMPYGAYLAVRMNAELGTQYDELKMLNWSFDGDNSDRDGWGVVAENWEGYDVHGLVGQKKWEQYAFAMNTFSHAAALVPIVKYNPAYSHSIGKWMLNLANASRLFYADEHPRNRQTSAVWDGDPDHVICYEGLRKDLDNGNFFGTLKGVLAEKGPYAIGDQFKHLKSLTDICPYGSAWVGMLAAIVEPTNVEGILQLDCNATDFFGKRDFPTWLVYNPHKEGQKVTIQVPESESDLYDLVTKKYIARKVSRQTTIDLHANDVVTLIAIPSNTKTRLRNNVLMCDKGRTIDFKYKN
jgi:hypothetical protein